MTTAIHAVDLAGIGPVQVTVADYGSGQPFLLLHGGAGPASVTGFAEQFAAAHDVHVLVPTHSGFGGTPRPEALNSVGGLAALYDALVGQLDLQDVTVIGNSIGGWITAEIALLKSPRVSGIVLIDAVGIEVPGHPVADFFSLTMDQVFQRSFHNPDPFRIDPATLPPAAQAIAAGNRTAISVYAGTAMTDPTLARRLGSLEIPTLVLWGSSDRIVDADYGRAYAAAIPMARFQLLPDTGHSPQLETPDQVIHVIWDSADRYRHLAVTGAGPARHELPNLKPPEQQLYAHLVQHAADHGTGLLLEQERIPWAHAYQQLTDTIGTPASPG